MPTIHLTARMKDLAVKHAQRTGIPVTEAAQLARIGLLTSDGRLKFKGGRAPKPGERRKSLDVTDDEMDDFRRRVREARSVGLAKDELGYYVTNGRRRSSSYPTVGRIPVAVIRDYAG